MLTNPRKAPPAPACPGRRRRARGPRDGRRARRSRAADHPDREPAAPRRPGQLVQRPGHRRAGRQLPARQHGLLHQSRRLLPPRRHRRTSSVASPPSSSSAPKGRVSRLAAGHLPGPVPPVGQLPAGEISDVRPRNFASAMGWPACTWTAANGPARRSRPGSSGTARRRGPSTASGEPCSSRRSTSGSIGWTSATPARSSSTASSATATGSAMEIPLVPLGELYGTRLESWLKIKRVEVRLATGVRSIDVDDEGVALRRDLRSGEAIDGRFRRAHRPVRPRPRAWCRTRSARGRLPALANLSKIESSPITGVHLWFDRADLPVGSRRPGRPARAVGLQPHGAPGPDGRRGRGPISATGHQRRV